jgi:hypothetical protein
VKTPILALLILTGPAMLGADSAATFIADRRAQAAPSFAAAQTALSELRGLAAIDRTGGFGLSDPAIRSAAQTGTFFPVYMIGIDVLRHFDAKSKVDRFSLLTDTHVVEYTVVTDSTTRTLLEVQRKGTAWVTAGLGGEHYAAWITGALERLHLSADNTILVDIPALNLHFLAFTKDNDQLMLASLVAVPEFGIDTEAHSLDAVLTTLVTFALKSSDKPV